MHNPQQFWKNLTQTDSARHDDGSVRAIVFEDRRTGFEFSALFKTGVLDWTDWKAYFEDQEEPVFELEQQLDLVLTLANQDAVLHKHQSRWFDDVNDLY